MVGHSFVCTWMLVLITFVSPILTQNNTCHRIESYEVEIMVPIKEPVTFRSYTWCLKVPPRCSKYTVQYRERLTYETEVRNRTVSECCAGFVQLYSECVSKCSDCNNFQCNSTTNQCTCLPGFVGSLCNETCEDGKWGDRCSEVCICRIDENCDKATGVCTPKPTEDPEIQLLNINTTTTLPIVSSQSSLGNPAIISTTNLATSSQTISKSQITSTSTYIDNFITAKPITMSTSHNTALFTTLPSTTFTVPYTSIVENNSTVTLTTNFTKKPALNSQLPPTSDTDSATQTFVRNDFTVDNVLTKVVNNNFTTTTLLVHNVTSYIETTVTEPVPEEVLLSTSQPSEITSVVKPNMIKSIPIEVSTSTTIVHSSNISNIKSQISKPVPKELLSTSETVLSTLNIPQGNYSKEISIESSPDFSLNATMVYARWINEFSTNTSITLAVALVFLVLVIVTTSVIVHCCSHKSSQLANGTEIKEESNPTLFSRSGHYDVPGPPTFSFINAYALDLLTKDIREANYDHPCSARCLVNEPVYDELRY